MLSAIGQADIKLPGSRMPILSRLSVPALRKGIDRKVAS
jgi:hypothetical protein